MQWLSIKIYFKKQFIFKCVCVGEKQRIRQSQKDAITTLLKELVVTFNITIRITYLYIIITYFAISINIISIHYSINIFYLIKLYY